MATVSNSFFIKKVKFKLKNNVGKEKEKFNKIEPVK